MGRFFCGNFKQSDKTNYFVYITTFENRCKFTFLKLMSLLNSFIEKYSAIVNPSALGGPLTA